MKTNKRKMTGQGLSVCLLLMLIAIYISACRKVEDGPPAVANSQTPGSNSLVRLVRPSNIGEGDLIISGKILTNLASNGNTTTPSNTPTRNFPADGKWSGTYTIPDSFFVNNKAEIKVVTPVSILSPLGIFLHDSLITVYDTIVSNTPTDIYFRNANLIYYVFPDAAYNLKGYPFTRDLAPPQDPTKVKIRIINLFDDNGNTGQNGTIGLTYADGSVVSTGNNNIPNNGGGGAYVEIPYGTYQFHVFYQNASYSGYQLNEDQPVGSDAYLNGIDTRLFIRFPYVSVTSLHTLQPGGIYTVVAGLDNLTYKVSADNSPVNNSYARLQWVNALPGKDGPDIRVDGLPIDTVLNFGQSSGYGIYTRGPHQVSVSWQGTLLCQETLTLQPSDALTLWAYETPGGYKIINANTDMSISIYNIFGANDNTSKGLVLRQAAQVRFLNLAPDLPYMTFTNGDQLFRADPDAIMQGTRLAADKNTQHLPFATTFPDSPYVRIINADSIPVFIKAYANNSPLSDLPGTPLTDIDSLDHPFLANKDMYNPSQYYTLTNGEPGLYSVALIGKINSSDAGERARLIVVKHNK